MDKDHHKFMEEAELEAKKGLESGGIPIGAVLVKDDLIVGRGHNMRVQHDSPILHAEIECLKNAGRMQADEYKRCILYTTLSPCEMCSGAILLFNIPIVVIGENENFKGPEDYLESRGVDLINLNHDYCKKILGRFIEENRTLWDEDISC